MSAETLRRAATRMRHNASNATPGRWKLWGMTVMSDQDGTSNVDTAVNVAQTYYRDGRGKPRTWDAEHVIGMQPVVALAVADWLDDVACDLEADIWPDGHDVPRNALVVACAYLGETA